MLRVVLVLALIVPAAACGDDEAGGSGRPTVVATTSVLGDVVANVVGDLADVVVLVPAGTDPHEFQPSARQVQAVEAADAIVTNGLGFEEGLLDVVAAATARGVPSLALGELVDPLDSDPHWFNDPVRMAAAVDLLADHLAGAGLDEAALGERADAYRAELERLHGEVEEVLASIPESARKLVTNHETFSYFAARYGFEYLGAVIPDRSTSAEPGAAELEALAAVIDREGVPAIFVEASESTDLADAVARQVGHEVDVVALFSESLGGDGTGADTYLGMQRTNARLIAGALAR